jgi:hypothetical protein
MIVTALALASFTTGCFGQFALTRKLYNWNDGLGNKFVKTVVLWAFMIIPVYEVLGLADLWVLNVIEFWGGSNPVANLHMQQLPDGSVQVERDGLVMRLVPTGENRFDIFRDGKLAGTATVTGDRGMIFTMAESGQVVRLSPDDVHSSEQMTAKMQIAPVAAQ